MDEKQSTMTPAVRGAPVDSGVGIPRWHTVEVFLRRCRPRLLVAIVVAMGAAVAMGVTACSALARPTADSAASAVAQAQSAQAESAPVAADQPGASPRTPSATARPVPPTALPAGVAEPPVTTGQLVTVIAAGPVSTTAVLRAWERQPAGGWRATAAPLKVRVGTDGVGKASESSRRTPIGSYPLDQAFGRAPDPGTKLPYRHVGNDDWWVSDTDSASYNTYRHCRIGTCNFSESAGENLGQAGASYDYAVVIGYNTAKPVAGAGSAFFLHVDAGAASAGCVEVPRATVVSLLRWLDPGRHPRISITTG